MASPETPSNDKAQIIEEEKTNMMDDKIAKLLTACVLIANLLAVVALVLAFVGVARNGSNEYYITTSASSSSSSGNTLSGEKVWMFQIGHYQSNTQYLDEETQTIKGYNVDVVNAVCQLAGKNCVLVWDVYENCWTSVPGQRSRAGVGLMGRWYDACVGWTNTYDRARTLSFSDDFEKPVDLALWVKPGGNIPNWPNLANAKIGFLDGWLTDQHCLNRYSDIMSNFDPTDVSRVIHYPREADVLAALQSGESPCGLTRYNCVTVGGSFEDGEVNCKTVKSQGTEEQIDGAFISIRPWNNEHPEFELFWQAPENRCVRGGLGMMVQKDQFELLTWWNAAFQRLTTTSQYEDICARLETAHGDQPGLSAEYVCV